MKLKKAMLELAHLKGKAKKKVSAEKYEQVRAEAFRELEKARKTSKSKYISHEELKKRFFSERNL